MFFAVVFVGAWVKQVLKRPCLDLFIKYGCGHGQSALHFCGLRHQMIMRTSCAQRVHRPSIVRLCTSSFDWLHVENGTSIESSPDAVILPAFPLTAIDWPGCTVELRIIDPAYRKMYNDLLASGARRFIVPFTKTLLPDGRVRYAEMPLEDRRMFRICPVLEFESIKDRSKQTQDDVKYVVQHSVCGLARLKRILNPSALFLLDTSGREDPFRGDCADPDGKVRHAQGNLGDYLRAEVEFLDDGDVLSGANMTADSAQRLIELWTGIYERSVQVGEPRMKSADFIKEHVLTSSTWRLAESWRNLKMALWSHRDRILVRRQAWDWIKKEQDAGRLPHDLPPDFNIKEAGLPQSLGRNSFLWSVRARKWNAHPGGGHCLPGDFWDPMLRLLSARNVQERSEILIDMAQEEINLMYARDAVRCALSPE